MDLAIPRCVIITRGPKEKHCAHSLIAYFVLNASYLLLVNGLLGLFDAIFVRIIEGPNGDALGYLQVAAFDNIQMRGKSIERRSR